MLHAAARSCTAILAGLMLLAIGSSARAADQAYFPAYQNVVDVLVQRINAETVRLDVGAWYLSEGAISIAIAKRFKAGVPVRIIGDRVGIFENDPPTKTQFYYMAARGVPIRLRYNPSWYPEIIHWKAIIFAGQGSQGKGLVSFGSANLTPFELKPVSSTDYKDETVVLSDDVNIVNAFKTKFDVMWNDTKPEEPNSLVIIKNPPYLKNWDDACKLESACADYAAYKASIPDRKDMVINTGRLEPDYDLDSAEMVWSQGPEFNNRLIQAINAEATKIDLVTYRLTVSNVPDALIQKRQSNPEVPVRLLIDPCQYDPYPCTPPTGIVWPEFWLTHANVDKLWLAGVQVKQRVHAGLTHMKTLITSAVATNASSNIAEFWQRDHDQFVPAATKPALYQAIQQRVNEMWNDPAAFGTFTPQPAYAASLVSPANQAAGVVTTTTLVWNRAPFATSYDVYLGTSSGSLTKVAKVPAVMTTTPPQTYSWKPSTPLQNNTTYFWRIVSRTYVTDKNPSLVTTSATRSFSTPSAAGGTPLPPPWTDGDVGVTGVAGSASFANGVYAVKGAGANIWGTADAFNYVYQPLAADGEVVAHVTAIENNNAYAKAGVMIRQSLTAGSPHVVLDVRPNNAGIEFMTRATPGGSTTFLGTTTPRLPLWLKLTRAAGRVTAAVSDNGTLWTTVGSTPLTGAAYIGLVVSSHDTSHLNTSTFDHVSVTIGGTTPPPPPWTDGDVGVTGVPGSASFATTGVYTVKGAGANIWGTADAFNYVYQPLVADGEVVAHVTAIENNNAYAKAGVMIRQLLTAGSPHVVLDVRPNNAGIEFMTRATPGGSTTFLGTTTPRLPLWLKLTRAAGTVTAAVSDNGTLWTTVGSTPLTGAAYIGLVVSSHDPSRLNTSTFDNVRVTIGGGGTP
jgi:hypothetical protein